jgi:protease-4
VWERPELQTTAQRIRAVTHNALTRLPGRRPSRVVVELAGSFPARRRRPELLGFRLPQLGSAEMSLHELADAMRALARAPWLGGVTFRVERLRVGYATAYALRRQIHALRAAGKATSVVMPIVSQTAYYVAAAADEIVVPESADVHLVGFGARATYMRDALAKLGMRFEKVAIGEYKSALDELVEQHMSPAHREQLDAMLAALERRFADDIATDRGKRADDIRAALDEGITSARRLHELGLVDRVAYEEDEPAPLARAQRFLEVKRPAAGKRIGVVSVAGVIAPGRSRRLPVGAAGTAGSETIARSIRNAAADPNTAAIVLHVDSPGGSALASDLIWHEVKRANANKPVVAAMGAVAASGGYYICAAARHVIAAPATITGSIGVVSGKLVAEGLLARLGLSTEVVERGRFVHLDSPTRGLTDAERALLQRASEEVYARFTARVAEGRRLTAARVHELGRGRIWAGADALGAGLVDELGDIELAIERAAELAGIARDAPVWDVPAATERLPLAAVLREPLGWLAEEHHLLWCPIGALA